MIEISNDQENGEVGLLKCLKLKNSRWHYVDEVSCCDDNFPREVVRDIQWLGISKTNLNGT